MQSLSRLRAERYSSSSGHRLSGPLLQSYHGSPRHSWKQQQKKTTSFSAVLARLVVLLLVVVGCYVGGKHYMYRRSQSENKDDFLASLGLGSGQSSFRPPSLWPPSDLGLKMPSWAQAPADPESAAKALKGTRAGRLFGDEGFSNKQQPNRGSLGSMDFDSQQLKRGEHSPPLPPSAQLSNQQQQESTGGASTDDALLASADVRATPAPTPSTAVAAGAAGSQQQRNTAAEDPDFDPLHDSLTDSEKEAEQLSALSRVIQQQQDTITKQTSALQELQKRFDQQEHQLAAATATAASTNGSEGVQVEPYFPEDKVQQELTMLHKVEAQIEAVSRSVDEATKALPNLSKDQQTAQLAEIQRADQLMGRLSRVAAAINLRTSDPLTESGHDPVVELRHYYGTVANDLTLNWKEALGRQNRPSAEQLGLSMDPFTDSMSDLDTLDLRLEYVAAMMQGMADSAPCKLALATTWSGDLWGLRKELIPWLTYHAYLGVSKLYVLYEGDDPRTLRELYALQPWVKVILARPPLATQAEAQAFESWVNSVPDAHIKEWKAQPGNYHLMTKQGYAVTTALQLARADNVTWLMHLDPDELLHPGASHSAGMLAGTYSLLPELCNAPAHVPSIRFTNIEGVPEAADLTNRYEQVTLFRAHRHLVPPQIQPFRYIFKQGHADAWLHLYTNGKSAVRPDAPGVTQGGPHVFLGPADKRWSTPENPHGIWRPAISNSTLVLHYAYATPGDVAVKAGRSCPPGVVEAVLAGNTSQASQCFVLDLDQRAFLAAVKDRKAAGLPPVPAAPPQNPAADSSSRGQLSSGPIVVDPATYFGSSTSSGFSNTSWPVGQHVLDFFWGELTLSEGAPFECLTPDGKSTGWCSMKDVDKLKSLLISSGLMMRLHAPAQTMKGIETAIQQLMLLGHRRASDTNIPAIVMASPAQVAESAMAAAAAAEVRKQRMEAISQQQQQQPPQQQPGRTPPQQQASGDRQPTADQAAQARRTVPPTDPSRVGVDDRRPGGQGRPAPSREWEQRQDGYDWAPRDGPVGQRRWEDERMREEGQRMRAWFDRPERRRPVEPRNPGDYRGDPRRQREGPAGAGGRQSRDEPAAMNRDAYSDGRRIQQDAVRGVEGQRGGQQQDWDSRSQPSPRQQPQEQQRTQWQPRPAEEALQAVKQQQQQQLRPAEQVQQAIQQQPGAVQGQQAAQPQQQQQPAVQVQGQQQQQPQQRERGWQEAEVPQERIRDRNLIS